MTQSTLRFLIGGLLTVGLLASLARGDDKQRSPEVLPAPKCAACDKAADCCSPGASCCQEGSECCTKANGKSGIFSVGVMPAGVDFNRSWCSSLPSESNGIFGSNKKRPESSGVHLDRDRVSQTKEDILFKLHRNTPAFDYRDKPLNDVIDDLADFSRINVVPLPALEDANINQNQPITMKLEGATLESALKLILCKANLTFEVQNDAVVIKPDLRDCCRGSEPKAPKPCCAAMAVALDLNKTCDSCCQSARAAKSIEANATPTIIIIQPPSSVLEQLAVSAFCEFAEWVGGSACVPENQIATRNPSCTSVPASPVLFSPTGVLTPVTNFAVATQQPLPCMAKDAQGNTRVGLTIGSFSSEPSPLPPPVPTFRVPPAVSGEKSEARPVGDNIQFLTKGEFQIPLLSKDQLWALAFCDSGTTETNPGSKDYRVSIGSGLRIQVPMLGPVPVALEFGLPMPKLLEAPPPYPFDVVKQIPSPGTMRDCVSPVPVGYQATDRAKTLAPNTTQVNAQFAPFGFLGVCENSGLRAACQRDVPAVPVSYVPPVANMPSPRVNKSWTMRVLGDGERPAMSVQSESASMICTNLDLRWKQDMALQFAADKKCVRVNGEDFTAEAEAIECRESEGKLVFSGNVTLIRSDRGNHKCVIKAERVVWDSGDVHVEKAPGSSR